MKCMHCLIEYHSNLQTIDIGIDSEFYWQVYQYLCPNCMKFNLYLVAFTIGRRHGGGFYPDTKKIESPIYPKGNHRACPIEVPSTFSEDYKEACIILNDSPKASAALSRRCLQSILREVVGVKRSNLEREIQEAIESRNLPSHIITIIDAVRNIGNFAAHPIKSLSTGEIVEVEPGEAELNLDVLEALFDFYFVQPAVIAKKKEELNKKLRDAGKKEIA